MTLIGWSGLSLFLKMKNKIDLLQGYPATM